MNRICHHFFPSSPELPEREVIEGSNLFDYWNQPVVRDVSSEISDFSENAQVLNGFVPACSVFGADDGPEWCDIYDSEERYENSQFSPVSPSEFSLYSDNETSSSSTSEESRMEGEEEVQWSHYNGCPFLDLTK